MLLLHLPEDALYHVLTMAHWESRQMLRHCCAALYLLDPVYESEHHHVVRGRFVGVSSGQVVVRSNVRAPSGIVAVRLPTHESLYMPRHNVRKGEPSWECAAQSAQSNRTIFEMNGFRCTLERRALSVYGAEGTFSYVLKNVKRCRRMDDVLILTLGTSLCLRFILTRDDVAVFRNRLFSGTPLRSDRGVFAYRQSGDRIAIFDALTDDADAASCIRIQISPLLRPVKYVCATRSVFFQDLGSVIVYHVTSEAIVRRYHLSTHQTVRDIQLAGSNMLFITHRMVHIVSRMKSASSCGNITG
jgi:hypothetical protein